MSDVAPSPAIVISLLTMRILKKRLIVCAMKSSVVRIISSGNVCILFWLNLVLQFFLVRCLPDLPSPKATLVRSRHSVTERVKCLRKILRLHILIHSSPTSEPDADAGADLEVVTGSARLAVANDGIAQIHPQDEPPRWVKFDHFTEIGRELGSSAE